MLITSNYRQIWRPNYGMSLLVSNIAEVSMNKIVSEQMIGHPN